MKKSKILKWWVVAIADITAFGVVLCSFCYFHHIRDMWFLADDESSVNTTVTAFTKPVISTTSRKPIIQRPGTSGIITEIVTDISGNTSVKTEIVPPPDVFVDQGDFGARFPNVFLAEDETPVVTEYEYRSHDVAVTFERATTTVGKETVYYYFYDIYIRNIENFYTSTTETSSTKKFNALEEMTLNQKDENGNLLHSALPVLSMSGDMWSRNNVELAERNGKVYTAKGYDFSYVNTEIGVLYYDGTFEVVSPSAFNWNQIAGKAPYQIWYFGPGLLDSNGKPKGDSSADYKIDGATCNGIIGGKNPRVAIGYYEPGHYCFVVVEGRQENTGSGVSVPNLAKIMSERGCVAAYNLDGGNSAKVKFNGVFHRLHDYNAAERSINDILCIGEVIKYD